MTHVRLSPNYPRNRISASQTALLGSFTCETSLASLLLMASGEGRRPAVSMAPMQADLNVLSIGVYCGLESTDFIIVVYRSKRKIFADDYI